MGNSLTSCSTTVVGKWGGDHVAGIIWLFSFTNAPYGGFSTVSNYPFGENLTQPQLITSAVHMVPAWLISHVVGPVCAWNLMVLAGYMLSALIMYGFVYWLLRNKWIALFGGAAVSFTPYHYYKSWGHLSYIYSGLFVALLWLFLAFWGQPTRNKAIGLGILFSLLFYSDGYFPLIGGTMMFALGIYGLGSIVVDAHQKKQLFILNPRIRYLLLSLLVSLVLLLPIVFTKIKYGARIESSLINARSDILKEIEEYGARGADYFIPPEDHPVPAIREIAAEYREEYRYSNDSEYHLYLGVTVVLLAVYAVFTYRKKRLEPEHSRIRWVVGGCVAIILVAGLVSLVPEWRIFGVTVPLPSGLIGRIVNFWRVFARLYLVISIALTTVAAIGLWHLSNRIKGKNYRLAFILLITILSLFEFIAFNPFRRNDQWDVNSGNQTYQWLRNQSDIGALAAYPLIEHPFNVSYFGDQVIHQKALLNSKAAVGSELLLHRSLSGLGDGQTLGVLHSLGIKELLLYRIDTSTISPSLESLYGNYGAKVLRIKENVKPLTHVLVPDAGFDRPEINPETQISCRRPLGVLASLSVRNLTGEVSGTVDVSFELKGQPGQLPIIHGNGRILYSATFDYPGQTKLVNLTLQPDQQIHFYHLSDSRIGFTSVCNLTTYK